VEEVLHVMVTKSMDIHVLPKLASATIFFASFDLWMSERGINMFVVVINYLSENWEPTNANVGMFEVNETTDPCIA
jgi:hypothetical protein